MIKQLTMMKKIYQKPITDCAIGFQSYSIMAGSLTSDGDGNWSQSGAGNGDTSDPTKEDGRANPTNVWDTL